MVISDNVQYKTYVTPEVNHTLHNVWDVHYCVNDLNMVVVFI